SRVTKRTSSCWTRGVCLGSSGGPERDGDTVEARMKAIDHADGRRRRCSEGMSMDLPARATLRSGSSGSRRRMGWVKASVSPGDALSFERFLVAGEVVRDGGDDHAGPEQQRPFDEEGGLVVEEVVPPAGGDELRQDDRDHLVRILLAQVVDVI